MVSRRAGIGILFVGAVLLAFGAYNLSLSAQRYYLRNECIHSPLQSDPRFLGGWAICIEFDWGDTVIMTVPFFAAGFILADFG
jgi:hypothetical protein